MFCFRFFLIIFPQASEKKLKRYTTGINDTGDKFATSGDKKWVQYQTAYTSKWTRKDVSMLTLQPKGVQTKYLKLFFWKIGRFANSVNYISGTPWTANISANLKKKLKRPNGIHGGSEETDSRKNQKTKILWHCLFNKRIITLSSYRGGMLSVICGLCLV